MTRYSRSHFASMFAAAVTAGLGRTVTSTDMRGYFDASPKRPSKRYPEQSSRQAMRAHRRQQGGPGIVLSGAVYVPRT